MYFTLTLRHAPNFRYRQPCQSNKILKARNLEGALVTGKESYSACGAQEVIDRLLDGFDVERFVTFPTKFDAKGRRRSRFNRALK